MPNEQKEQPRTPTDLLVKELESFLTSDTPEVLCIRGRWGVGKTHLWDDVLKRLKNRIALAHYAYVSLFGVGDLDRLRYAIFENTVPRDKIGLEPSLETLRENLGSVTWSLGKRALSLFQHVPGAKNVIEGLQAASFLAVNKRLICIDDLERKGEKLRIIDILGQISQLRERRACKVVLILNDEELEEADKKALEKYQEKVIETSVVFAPTPEECAKIAIEADDDVSRLMRAHAVTLGISNIRVIVKIGKLVAKVQPIVAGMHEQVLNQIVMSLVLFGWMHFAKPEPKDGPSIVDFVFKKRGRGMYGTTNEKKLDAVEMEWDKALDKLGFRSADELDVALYDGVVNGFFDEERIKALVQSLNEKFADAAALDEWRAAWAVFRGPFADNEREVIKGLLSAYGKNVARISLGEVDSLCSLLREFGHADEVDRVVRSYVEVNKGQPLNFWNPSDMRTGIEIRDKALKEEFEKRFVALREIKSPEQILLHIYAHNSWSPEDIDALVATPVEDYVAMFKRLDETNAYAVAKTALGFNHLVTTDPRYRQVAGQATEALKRIAAESRINRRRVANLGVEV